MIDIFYSIHRAVYLVLVCHFAYCQGLAICWFGGGGVIEDINRVLNRGKIRSQVYLNFKVNHAPQSANFDILLHFCVQHVSLCGYKSNKESREQGNQFKSWEGELETHRREDDTRNGASLAVPPFSPIVPHHLYNVKTKAQ